MPAGIYKHPPQCGFQKGHKIWTGKKRGPRSDESKKKQSKLMLGRKLTEKHKKKIGEGCKKYFKNNPIPDERKKRIGDSQRGEKCHLWVKEKSHPYSFNWTETLRRDIRERDNYTCQMPKCDKQKLNKAFDVHHIDYNKKNCNSDNLITLCHGCHSKTNNKKRRYWMDLFQNLIVMHYEEKIT